MEVINKDILCLILLKKEFDTEDLGDNRDIASYLSSTDDCVNVKFIYNKKWWDNTGLSQKAFKFYKW